MVNVNDVVEITEETINGSYSTIIEASCCNVQVAYLLMTD